MKTIKKIAGIVITVLLLGGTVYQLFSNKKEMEEELKKLADFSAVVPVKTITATSQKVEQQLTEYGTFRPQHEVNVVSETQGEVLRVLVSVGDYVKEGRKLAVVEEELLEDKMEVARLNLENAGKDLERFTKLAAGEAVTKRQFESMQLNFQNAQNTVSELQKLLNHTDITSPVSGFITSRHIEKGSFVTPGTPFFVISSQSELLFAVQLSETDVMKVKKGDFVEIQTPTLSGKMTGKIHEVAVKNTLSGRYEVLVKVRNPDAKIKPGMGGTATFLITDKKEAIVIPRKCITGTILEAHVFRLQHDIVKIQPIEASRLNEELVIVHSGISMGEQIVTEGQINLKDGTKVRIIND
jgi:RND family efflux transporter MFP subunit